MPSVATKSRKSESVKAKTSRPSRQSAAVRNILSAGVQPKLKIGAVNDPAEIEADRVADQVMRMPTPSASAVAPAAPPPTSGSSGVNGAGPTPVRRKCAACDDDKIQRKPNGAKTTNPKINTPPMAGANFTPPTIRMKATGGASGDEVGGTPASTGAESAINSLGSGSPLASSERTFFEPRFGRDLSNIRVHTNGTADTASRAINARAFSLGNNIAFANGEYQPGTHAGRTLMAHEITHSLQGGNGVGRVVRRKCNPSEALNLEEGLSGSVGKGGTNIVSDTIKVQEKLLNLGYFTYDDNYMESVTFVWEQDCTSRLKTSEIPRTIRAIESFQQIELSHKPDGILSRTGTDYKVLSTLSANKDLDKELCKTFNFTTVFSEISGLSATLERTPDAQSERKVIRLIKFVKRCGSPDEIDKIKKLIETKLLPKHASSVWSESGKAFGGYTGMYPGYYKGGKGWLDRLGTSAEAPSGTFPFDLSRFEADPTTASSDYDNLAQSVADNLVPELRTTDILYFYGHQYAQYNGPGLFADYHQNNFIDLRNLKKHGVFNNVKLIVSTSCATCCKEAVDVFAPLFPNAVILGYRKSAPSDGEKVRRKFELGIINLMTPLLLDQAVDVGRIIGVWKSVVMAMHPNENSRLPGYYRSGQVHYLENGKWKSMPSGDAGNTCKKKGVEIGEAAH